MAVRGIVTALPACSPPGHILPEEDEGNGSDSRGQSPQPPTAASDGQERPARRRECRPRRTERAGQRAAEVRYERRRDDPPNQSCARHRGQGTSPGLQAMTAIIVSAPAALREQPDRVTGKMELALRLAALRQGPSTSTTASIARRWLALMMRSRVMMRTSTD